MIVPGDGGAARPVTDGTEASRFLFDRDLVIRAGAGSGKTWALVTQYLHLLAGLTARRAPLRPSRIVAITFTEKAAAELASRIRERVARLAGLGRSSEGPRETDLERSAAALGVDVPGPEHWESCLAELGAAPVGTFHSFGGSLLRRHAIAAGLDPGFRVLDDEEAGERLRRVVEEVVLAALMAHEPPVEALVDELGYVGRGRAPGLVESLMALVRRRAEEGVGGAGLAANYDPALLRRDLNLAVSEFQQAAADLVAFEPTLPKGSAEKVRQFKLRLPQVLLSIDPSSTEAGRRLGELFAEISGVRGGKHADTEALAATRKRLKDAREMLEAALLGFRAAPLAQAMERLVVEVEERWAEDKRRAGALDFSDLLVRARDLVRDHERVRASEQARADALLVDEFQDTNRVQAELVWLLGAERPADNRREVGAGADPGEGETIASASGGRLLVVGDRKQSIYEFRGADVAVAVRFEERLLDPARGERQGRAIALGDSRRSRPALVHLANAFFREVMRGGPARWAVHFEPWDALRPIRTDGDHDEGGYEDECLAELLKVARHELVDIVDDEGRPTGAAALRPAGGRAASTSTSTSASTSTPTSDSTSADADDDAPEAPARKAVKLDAATLRWREAQALAQRLRGLRRDHSTGSIALLLRAFTHLDVYLDALRTFGVPYYVVNGRGFFETQEVRDLAAALRILDDPDDLRALVTVLRSPMVALGDDTLARLAMEHGLGHLLGPDPTPLVGIMDPGERARLDRYRDLHRDLARRADRLGPSGCLRALVEGTDLVAVLAAGYHGEQRVANLERLVDRARMMELEGTDLRGYVRWLSTLAAGTGGRQGGAQAQIVGEHDDVVRVMTVHQAKGLEFDVVAVAGCGGLEPPEGGNVVYDPDEGLGIRMITGPAVHSDTAASLRVKRVRTERRQAESLRLLYVAMTRARDRLILSGESARRGTWRSIIDEALRSPEVGVRLRVREILPPRPRLQSSSSSAATAEAETDGEDAEGRGAGDSVITEDSAPAEGRLARTESSTSTEASASTDLAAAGPSPEAALDVEATRLLARLAPRPVRPRALSVAVTQLADFAVCPRRYQLFHAAGLAEHPHAGRAPSSELALARGDLDPLSRGTLAHHLLEHADFARAGADLDDLLAADGYDPTQPEVAEVREHARRFLETPFARGLAASSSSPASSSPASSSPASSSPSFASSSPSGASAPPRLRRELPFLLAVAAPGGLTLRLRGQIDLVVLERGGAVASIVDYKHARAGSEGHADDYRLQLDCYALAASALWPAAERLRVGLAFLREPDPTPRFRDVDRARLAVLRDELGALGAALARAPEAGELWEGRPVETCREVRCGFLYRCHPSARPT